MHVPRLPSNKLLDGLGFFFFDMLESAIVFLDEYQGRKMMADILSSQFPMTRPITKLVLSIGIMASV